MTRKDFLNNVSVLGAAAFLAPSAFADSGAQPSAFTPLNRKVRVGLIGCGSVSGVYLPHLATCTYAVVVSLCDIKPVRAEKAAKKFSGANAYPHIDKMLADGCCGMKPLKVAIIPAVIFLFIVTYFTAIGGTHKIASTFTRNSICG